MLSFRPHNTLRWLDPSTGILPFYSIGSNTISISQKRKLRLSRIKKHAKSCPWKITMLSFEHFTTNKSSLQALRLTHTLEHSAGRNGTLSTVADISCVSYTPVWPITNSDVSSVQRPKTLFAPWDGLKAQHFWRAADNCSCGSSNSHQWLEAPPQTAGAGALGSCCEKDVVTWKPAQEVALHFLVSLLK